MARLSEIVDRHPTARARRTAARCLDREAAARYVLSRRAKTGGYCFYLTPEWGVEEANALDTLAALESLQILGVDPPEPMATVRWLAGLQSQDGGYGSLTIGWAALRALDVLDGAPKRPVRAWVSKQLELLEDHGGEREWRAALLDALRISDLLRLSGEALRGDRLLALSRLLEVARDAHGGWARPGADLQTTGIAVRIIELAGIKSLRDCAEGDCAEEFLRRCEDPVLGLRAAPGSAATSAGALWGGVTVAAALRVGLGYPQAVAQSIALLQNPGGGLGVRHQGLSTLLDTWLGLRAASVLASLGEGTI